MYLLTSTKEQEMNKGVVNCNRVAVVSSRIRLAVQKEKWQTNKDVKWDEARPEEEMEKKWDWNKTEYFPAQNKDNFVCLS